MKDKEFVKQYNNENYIQQVSVFRLKSEDPSPKNREYDQGLLNDNINHIQIISDIMFPLLTATVKFTDTDNKFIHKIIPDSRCFCRIFIQKVNRHEVEFQFEHLFIVRDLRLLSKETNTFELDLVSHYWFNFNNLLVYSTTNNKEPNAKKSYTEIIYEMMKKSNINIKKPTVQTTLKTSYTTPVNYSLMQSFNDVIKLVDKDNGIIFLKYNPLDNMYEIISVKEVFKNHVIKTNNKLIFPTKKTTGDNRRMLLDTKLTNDIGFQRMVNAAAPQTLKTFSYEDRKWTDVKWTRKKVDDMFYKPIEKSFVMKYKTVPNFVPAESRKIEYETLGLNFINSDQYRELLVSSETVQGETDGVLERTAGDLCFLFVDPKNRLVERFLGVWFITRIYHNFSKNTYKNVLQIGRSDHYGQIGKEESTNRGKNV